MYNKRYAWLQLSDWWRLVVYAVFPLFLIFPASLYIASPADAGPPPWLRGVGYAAISAPFALLAVSVVLHRACQRRDGFHRWSPGAVHSWDVHRDEWEACCARREQAGVSPTQLACALSLPGGGIRQSNFAIGAVLYLSAEGSGGGRPLWPHVDYVSSVSGGGYAATSLVSHLMKEPGHSFDTRSRAAVMKSAQLLRRHANWPMERNWPSCLDAMVGCSPCLAAAWNCLFLVGFGVVQFAVPFLFVWSISVLLIPAALLATIDLPAQIPGLVEYSNWSTWWLRGREEGLRQHVLLQAAAVLLCLQLLRLLLGQWAARLQGSVNRSCRGGEPSEAQARDESRDRLVVRHARVLTGMHLAHSLFALCAAVWLLAAAFFSAGLSCGTFFGSRVKGLDLSLLGSIVLLCIVSQSQSASRIELPAVLFCLGAAMFYSFGCVHFEAWRLGAGGCGAGCETCCERRHLAARFFGREYFHLALVLWGLQPLLHGAWTQLMPNWYSWKLSRFLPDPALALGDLREGPPRGVPYLLMCSVVHHVWRLPHGGPGSALERLDASAFVMSPLYVGGDSVGFVGTGSRPHRHLRVAAAAAISGAATSNRIHAATEPIHHLLTFFSGLLLGRWLQFEPDADVPEPAPCARAAAMLTIGAVHFAGSAATLLAYESCYSSSGTCTRWSCPAEGRLFVLAGLGFVVLEVFVLPAFMTWATSIWQCPAMGRWLSEWMQLHGFSFPHGASHAGGLPRHVYLSDGGHLDNLGILEPLRRRSRLIVCPHAGWTNSHTVNNLQGSIRRAEGDPSIHASFVPLAWDGAGLSAMPGSLKRACDEFALDMTRSCFIVGVDYAPYMPGLSGFHPVDNRWAVMILLVNRPASEADCRAWGVPAPGEDHAREVDGGLAEWHRFCASAGSSASEASLEPRMAALHERVGVGACCPCCHRWPPRWHWLLAKLGRFPNHKTPVQCLTPETAEAYQGLGFAVAAMNAAVLRHAAGLLDPPVSRPW